MTLDLKACLSVIVSGKRLIGDNHFETKGSDIMTFMKTRDGTEISFKDWDGNCPLTGQNPGSAKATTEKI